MQASYMIWHAFCEPAMCDDIIAHGDKEPKIDAVVGQDSRVDKAIRNSTIAWLSPIVDDYKALADFIMFHMREANVNFGLDFDHLRSMQYTTYTAAENGDPNGHYDEHVDVFWDDRSMRHRKISAVLQLTDPIEYEGGDLVLKPVFGAPPPPEAIRARGTLIIFPAFTAHYVTPVMKGTRRSLVAWAEGPHFK